MLRYLRNMVMGTSKRFPFFQRAAVWCKAVGSSAQIPPGVAFLKIAVGKDGVARYSERCCQTP